MMDDGRERTARTASPVAELVLDTLNGRLSRREILRRSAALGLAAPMVAAMLKVAPVAGAQGTPAAPPPSGEPVVIGCPYNLTGSYASIDGPASQGSLLAAKELSASGGILGRPVELRIYDGKSDQTTVSNVVTRLIEEDEVPALVGLTDTGYFLAGGPIAQEAGVPFLDVAGTAPIITELGDYIFMLPFGDNVQAAAAAEFAQEKGWTTCALLFDADTDYTTFLAEYFKERYTDDEIQGELLDERSYPSGETDFSSPLTEIKNLDPQPAFVYIASNPAEIGIIVKQARDLGIELPIMGGDGYDTSLLVQLAGEATREVYFTTHQGIYGDDPIAKNFNAAYEAEYGNPPEVVFAALGYDGIKLMADAINRAGSLEGEEIRDALAATQGFQGASGTISYEPGSRIPSKSVVIIQVVDQINTPLAVVIPREIPEA